ncbi:hypothetical protein N7447_007489 [Penicillium robsamsonii]|uniref:uncharacterized protein n=1 Tax=Penicillium robsamsonii TaxID=1792511 RepID=UPI002547AC0F|nr:uncharacterized protein N7447_007489 [Penicillium robsamsonii]KAJ5817481.1 hypothetical protein N7447_007489 [Penicillium robsamsonii]
MTNHQYQDLALHEIPEEVTAHDISLFLRTSGKSRIKRMSLQTGQGKILIRTLVEMSVPLFISAATVCLYVESKLDPVKELADLIKDQAKYSTKMDKTYLPVLVRLLGGRDEEDKDLTLQYFQRIVGSIILFADSLPVNALAKDFLDSRKAYFKSIGFISIVAEINQFKSFTSHFETFYCKQEASSTSTKARHIIISHFDVLVPCVLKLKKDICNLNNYGTKRMDIDERLINHHLQPELQYSCRYWVRHLEQCVVSSDMAQECFPPAAFPTLGGSNGYLRPCLKKWS